MVAGASAQEVRTVTAVFSAPANTPILGPRQPGLTKSLATIDDGSCGGHLPVSLIRDHIGILASIW